MSKDDDGERIAVLESQQNRIIVLLTEIKEKMVVKKDFLSVERKVQDMWFFVFLAKNWKGVGVFCFVMLGVNLGLVKDFFSFF